MKLLKSLCIVALILAVGSAELMAQHTYKFSDELGTYTVKFKPHDPATLFEQSPTKPLIAGTHELRIATSHGGTDWSGWRANQRDIYIADISAEAYQNIYYGPMHHYSLSLDYGYWVNEWLSIGGNFTYLMGCRNVFDRGTNRQIRMINDDYISILPMARFAWYRKGVLQLYSSAALGIGINRNAYYVDSADNWCDVYCAFDFKFLGLSVGRKWFAFIEAGYGARGIISGGIGCRINSKLK